MKRLRYVSYLATLAAAAGCATVSPQTTQRLADAEAAQRGAQVAGAASVPDARLHARFAEVQIATAKRLMKSHEDREADRMLMRAQSDAEVAMALAQERNAQAELDAALQRANAIQTMTENPGAKP